MVSITNHDAHRNADDFAKLGIDSGLFVVGHIEFVASEFPFHQALCFRGPKFLERFVHFIVIGLLRDAFEVKEKYVCDVCDYVYDPEVGDPDGGIAPGTSFEDLPDDWTCPVCGVTKDDFQVQK